MKKMICMLLALALLAVSCCAMAEGKSSAMDLMQKLKENAAGRRNLGKGSTAIEAPTGTASQEEDDENAVEVVREDLISEVSSAIDAIGEVTLESKEVISAARDLYDSLTIKEQVLVTNSDALIAAEDNYGTLKKAESQKIVEEYSKKFNITNDPIDELTWYVPKAQPKYIDTRSYIIPYIGVRNNRPWICIRYNSTGDDWIFWESMTIMVDGEKYNKNVGYNNVKRDSGRDTWECYDEVLWQGLTTDAKQLVQLKAIADSNETIIRFRGDDYHRDLYVTDEDKQTIRDTLILYEALLDLQSEFDFITL